MTVTEMIEKLRLVEEAGLGELKVFLDQKRDVEPAFEWVEPENHSFFRCDPWINMFDGGQWQQKEQSFREEEESYYRNKHHSYITDIRELEGKKAHLVVVESLRNECEVDKIRIGVVQEPVVCTDSPQVLWKKLKNKGRRK
jgi:hypothetical protein